MVEAGALQEESHSCQGLSWPREQSTPWTEHPLGSKPWARLWHMGLGGSSEWVVGREVCPEGTHFWM